jgi:uncharacterized protein DUF2398
VADGEFEPDLLADLGDVEAAQVVRCARVLLRRPLLREGGPDGELLPLVFKHRGHLVRLFSRHLGYRLRAERRFARLHKPAPADLPARGKASLPSAGPGDANPQVCRTRAARQRAPAMSDTGPVADLHL